MFEVLYNVFHIQTTVQTCFTIETFLIPLTEIDIASLHVFYYSKNKEL